ncbi:exo-alpha-sialidase, partial [Burkholderia pseudomallei]
PKLQIADKEPTKQLFHDEESVSANQTKAGTAYAVWDRLERATGNPPAYVQTAASRGPRYFSMSVDGGGSWCAPSVVV